MMLSDPDAWHALLGKLADLTVAFLRVQLDAGVDAIQVFDSWAGTLSLADYRAYVLPHSARVFGTLASYGVPMTHFGWEPPNCWGRCRPPGRRWSASTGERR
ncbi:uroporphyrinogen decarboxylase [Mycobacterium xenopi 4042]|uniref:Uroporphyrinogen decarboxylase n=1 Tax=Mycobacterium xenopi 4042 TaxID=1299334 RepID=X8CHU9_MYCXE|nr:uroporphyrinogen decarboxylase [Mycobacterium xenopi 4042]